MEKVEIGPVPVNEDCQQVGDGYDPDRARLECRQFIEQLRRQFGPEPEGASLVITSNAHDFGSYLDVVCKVDYRINAAAEYAHNCEGAAWPEWDATARAALGLDAKVRTFEVTITYKGTSTYFVDAADADTAGDLASQMFKDGNEDHLAGTHTESIENIETEEAPALETSDAV